MKALYLGTAAAEGIPGIFCDCKLCSRIKAAGDKKDYRARSQILFNNSVMLDFGPDSYLNAFRHNIDYSKIDHYVITHSHDDHLYVPDFIYCRPGYANFQTGKIIHIYANDTCCDMIEKYHAFKAEFLILHRLAAYTPFTINDLTFTPLPAVHSTTDKNEQTLTYLIEEKGGACFFYGNDTGILPDSVYEYLAKNKKHIDILSLDCTKGAIDYKYYTHMSFEENKAVYDKMAAVGVVDKNTICISTHFSHNCFMNHAELTKEAAKIGFIVAYDGMTVSKF